MNRNTVDVVIVGNIAHDVNTFPNRDNGKDLVVCNNGGAGYYSLIPASIYSKTGIVARVGNDFDLSKIVEQNIDLKGLKIVKDKPTTKFHHTYLSDDGQTRTFRPEIYENCMISEEDFPEEYFKAKYIHIATNFPKIQNSFIDLIRKKSNAIISIDTHEAYMETDSEYIKKVFDKVDIAFIDKEFTNLLDCNAPIKIIKIKKSGCKYIGINEEFIVNANETNVVDKTGAGDVVTGVFLAMMSKTNDKKKSLEEAVKMATESIKKYGVDELCNLKNNKKNNRGSDENER